MEYFVSADSFEIVYSRAEHYICCCLLHRCLLVQRSDRIDGNVFAKFFYEKNIEV